MEWENKEKYEQLIQFPKKKKLNQTGKTFFPNKNMKVLFQIRIKVAYPQGRVPSIWNESRLRAKGARAVGQESREGAAHKSGSAASLESRRV